MTKRDMVKQLINLVVEKEGTRYVDDLNYNDDLQIQKRKHAVFQSIKSRYVS